MGAAFEQQHGDYAISDDPARLDQDAIYAFLSQSYWAAHRERHTQELANRHSLCFGLYHAGAQVGFARVVTDHATFAYLADVYVLEAHRGQGLSHWLMDCVQAHPRLQGLRRWALATQDAHGLYTRHGWVPLANIDRWMERFDATANPPVASTG